jgi:hypothetical protein
VLISFRLLACVLFGVAVIAAHSFSQAAGAHGAAQGAAQGSQDAAGAAAQASAGMHAGAQVAAGVHEGEAALAGHSACSEPVTSDPKPRTSSSCFFIESSNVP